MTSEILNFLLALDVKEIHGYRPELGLRVFKEEALNDETNKKIESKSPLIKAHENNGNGKSNGKKEAQPQVNKKEIVNA